jgi:hypothetical protein
VQGTLAGIVLLPIRKESVLPGFICISYVWICQEGGHALDCLREGRVRIAALHGFQVELPASAEFLKANLGDAELDKKIKPSEGYLFLNNAGESYIGDVFIAFTEASCKFLKEVHARDTLYSALEIVALTPQGDSGQVTTRATVHNQRGELVLSGEHKYLLRRHA